MAQAGLNRKLNEVKERLGDVNFLDFGDVDIVTAHQLLGGEVRDQVHKILRNKLGKCSREQLREQIRIVRKCRSALVEKSGSPEIHHHIRIALHTYADCLSAWSKGAELDVILRDEIQKWSVDEEPISENDLALLLQNDETGCQTGVYREEDGSVLLWHTEEDAETTPGSRFDKLRVAIFGVPEGDRRVKISAFIYPDLLPGPAFGWRSNGSVQAVDTLHVEPGDQEPAVLANVAAWITLFLEKQVEPAEVIAVLAPFLDGYAITTVRQQDGAVRASRVEFGGGEQVVSILDEQPGSFLFQVNMFSQKAAAHMARYERLKPETREKLTQRIVRTESFLTNLPASRPDAWQALFKLMASTDGADFAYANEDVKAHLLCEVTADGMKVQVGAGPVVEGEDGSTNVSRNS